MRRHTYSSRIVNVISITCIFVLIALSTGISPVQGQTAPDQWTLVSQFGGSTQTVAVSGKLAYAGIGLRVNVLDINDPTKPKLLGMSEPFTDTLQDIVVQGKTVYAAAGSAGLQIMDVSDPTRPVTLGSWKSSGFAEGVAVMGKTLFLANGPKGVSVLDVLNPAKPIEISTAFRDYYAFDVTVFGNSAFIAAGEAGLLVLDIKVPASPMELSRLDTPGYAYETAQSNGMVYIADAWEGVQQINVKNPEKPVLSSTLATSGWSLGVAVSSKTLVSVNGAQGLDFFDTTNPANIIHVSSYVKETMEGDTMARRAVIAGDLVFVADTINGVRMVDIASMPSPKQEGIYSQLSYARRVTIDGNYAYVSTAGEGAMYAVNIEDPLQPFQVGKFQADGIAVDVAINDNFATLGTFEDSTNCYTLIDISDPSNLKLSDAIDLQSLVCGAPRQIAAQGNYVYSADEYGLSIYDLSQPGSIETIGRIELQQEGHQTVALSVSGDYAYVGDAGAGLKIVDVSDPANPGNMVAFSNAGNVGSIFSQGDVLYMGHYGGGITTSANPNPGALPSSLGQYQTQSSVEETTVSGDLLVASEGNGGLEILDVSDPTQIQFIQSIRTPGFAWASVIAGDYIYTANGAAGVLVFKKGAATQPESDKKQPIYPTIITNSIEKNYSADVPNFPADVRKAVSSKTCMVNSKADAGSGSLRECLTKITSGETILFDPEVFKPNSPSIISLDSLLPRLETGSVTIDASNAGVILDGQNQVPVGLEVSSSYNTIMGINFINFPMDGLTLDFPSEYNQIGGDHTIGEGPSGQGNAFSGSQNGIRVLYARNNTIKGNFVGTNATGTQAAKPNSIGIVISSFATENYIGGATVGEKNIISNNDRGVDIAANSASNNRVAGNYVGTDVTGTKAIPNTSWGILIEVGGRNNIIGGTTEEERNIISGNVIGVSISDYASTQNSIIGNTIGLDVSGTKALPNQDGSGIFQSAYNRIGGTKPGEANLISANTSNGIRLFGMGPIHALVMGNTFGLDATGEVPLGNNSAVYVDGGTHSMIGGIGESSGNLFDSNLQSIRVEYAGTSFNWFAGNVITGSSQVAVSMINNAANNYFAFNTISNSDQGVSIIQSTANTLHANAISANAAFGIENRDGGNLELEAPILLEATSTQVTGTACAGCLVEVFSDPADQGLIFEGAVIADASGSFAYSGTLTGPNITATATDLLGNTSIFSKAVKIK